MWKDGGQRKDERNINYVAGRSQAYNNEFLERTTVVKWHKRKGKDSVVDDPRPQYPIPLPDQVVLGRKIDGALYGN